MHAGESSGPEGVRDAIKLLGVCPTSNPVPGVCPSMKEHAIERLRRVGVAASLNTDAPALLGASLEREYALCSEAFAWTDHDLQAVARTSIAACFANDDVKACFREALARC